MPKSRKRPGAKKYRPKFDVRTEVSRFFEEIGLNPERDLRYRVLYHYTSTFSALKILEGQKFWATAHDCTNDKGELVSANAAIFEVAKAQRQTSKGLASEVLDIFLRDFKTEMIAQVRTAYLCCFSIARDDREQWDRYGGKGTGICMGISVINEPGPKSKELFSRLFEVVYSEEALREWFSDAVGKTCSLITRYPATAQNIKFALSSIRGLAAFASITTKTSEWSVEKEVRHVTMDNLEPGVKPSVRFSSDGQAIRYLPVSLRAGAKLIALDEIIIGAKQEFDAVRRKFEAVLASKGYAEGSIEYPRFTVSSAQN
jgi:hypothetical protein